MKWLLNWIKSFFKKEKATLKTKVVVTKQKKTSTYQRLPKCPAMLKTSYREQLAKSEAEKMSKKSISKIRAYKCEHCDYWHLTHKKNYIK